MSVLSDSILCVCSQRLKPKGFASPTGPRHMLQPIKRSRVDVRHRDNPKVTMLSSSICTLVYSIVCMQLPGTSPHLRRDPHRVSTLCVDQLDTRAGKCLGHQPEPELSQFLPDQLFDPFQRRQTFPPSKLQPRIRGSSHLLRGMHTKLPPMSTAAPQLRSTTTH